MNWFKNLKIRLKILFGIFIVAVIAVVIGMVGYFSLGTMAEGTQSLYKDRLAPVRDLGYMNAAVLVQRGDIRTLVAVKTVEERQNLKNSVEEQIKTAEKYWEGYLATTLAPEEQSLIPEVKQGWEEWKSISEQVCQAALNFEDDKVNQILNDQGVPTLKKVRTNVRALIDINAKLAEALNTELDDEASGSKSQILLVIILGFIGSIGLGYFIANIISKPVNQATEMISEMSDGNLKIRVDLDTKDEVGVMVKNMNRFADILQSFIKSMYKVSEGDLTVNLSKISDKDEITPGLNKIVDTLQQLQHETDLLTQAAMEGRTDYRGDTNKFNGGYKVIVEGFNKTIHEIITVVRKGMETLATYATGDFTVHMQGDYQNNYLVYKNSINDLGDSLTNLIGQVQQAVQATASASTQISSSSEEMAAGAQEQSAQTSEIATAVEQMAKTIVETTDNVEKAAKAAKNAGEIATVGGGVVKGTIEGMMRIADVVNKSAETVKELGKSSNQIGEIAQVIDDIADQTNLLALNAAIEAARAGEQGRGFAVVADEVRKLAERTAKATKEIATMIKQIQRDTFDAVESMKQGTAEVENGKMMANKAGDSLNEIIHSASDVVDIISQVAAASQEQSAAAEQISKNIESISSVTHESAAGTTQIARAAEDLNRLTENLQNIISQFKILETNNSFSQSNQGYAIRANGKLVKS